VSTPTAWSSSDDRVDAHGVEFLDSDGCGGTADPGRTDGQFAPLVAGVNDFILAVFGDNFDVRTLLGDPINPAGVPRDDRQIVDIARLDQQMRLFGHGQCPFVARKNRPVSASHRSRPFPRSAVNTVYDRTNSEACR